MLPVLGWVDVEVVGPAFINVVVSVLTVPYV